ncbi:HemK family modification methylase [Acanthamoeba castellanii str. Neff]|uniref:HemK family modification methylase n=1 Tax=Acanthamoeba castellanii (strain ATCC 30010 / Neff) TaxID=1257118 RepID=L8HAA4_ACACF|nr:HemK family modification methylase [Acanthamoeba castellanii str. Neff]ELR21628.1 HemK family modification methylase [Acanthamoeba castellanii str. Neff]
MGVSCTIKLRNTVATHLQPSIPGNLNRAKREELVRWGTQQIASSPARTDLHTGEGGTEPLEGRNVARLESEMFFSHALSTTTPDTVESLFRRLRGEPTAYILGQRQFWGFDFTVSPATLIPRPDTETVQRTLRSPMRSGCILLSLLSEFKEARGVGVDRSPQALQVARINAHRMRLTERCTFIESDWLDKVDGSERFDLVASNPPYIPRADLASLEPDVKDGKRQQWRMLTSPVLQF